MGTKKVTPKADAAAKSSAKAPAVPAAPVAPAPTPAAPKKTTAKAKTSKPAADGNSIPNDDIALRAYFIAEKRRLQGLPGDESQDWLEAERQIASERGFESGASKI